MTINVITQNSAAVSSNYSEVNSNRSGQKPPPLGRENGGGGRGVGVGRLLGAIANALRSLGQVQSSAATTTTNSVNQSSQSANDVNSTLAADESSSNDANSADNANNASQALGTFLQDLMAALQQSSSVGGPGKGAPPPADFDGGGGGPLARDLQNLMNRLSSSNDKQTTNLTSSATSTTASDSTSATSSDTTQSNTEALSQSFSNLLDALGLSNQDSNASLQNFLQTILSQVSQGGRQGNFVNTSA